MRLRYWLFAMCCSIAVAQPAFEVASIKPSGPKSVRGSEGGPGSSDPGMYRFGQATLSDLIATAYHVDYFQISGSGLDSQRFDLVAKIPDGSTKAQFRVMLQNLLAERFAMKVHIQSKEFAAYELVVAKGGAKLDGPVVAPKGDWPELPANRPGFVARHSISGGYQLVRVMSRQKTLAVLADFMRNSVECPVVDKTGLTGKYDFNLEYTVELAGGASDPPVVANVFAALPQQLGLQLVRAKVALDVVVVESFSRLPVEN